jgi:hypothetical protein
MYCFVAYTPHNMFRALVPIIRSPLQLPLQPLVTVWLPGWTCLKLWSVCTVVPIIRSPSNCLCSLWLTYDCRVGRASSCGRFALLCPSSGAPPTVFAASGYRMIAGLDVPQAVVGLHCCAHHQEPPPTVFAASGYRMIAGLDVPQAVVGKPTTAWGTYHPAIIR